MRTLIIVLTMALITFTFTVLWVAPTLAQVPRTVPLLGKDGQQIGTATFSGNRIFLRNPQNEIFAQIVIEADGSRTMYDANGKVLDRVPALEPKKD